MYVSDRINKLLKYCGLSPLASQELFFTFGRSQTPTHDRLDTIDTIMNVDTTHLNGEPCRCLVHIGGYHPCHQRRTVGARVALLEEIMAKEMAEGWEPLARGAPNSS